MLMDHSFACLSKGIEAGCTCTRRWRLARAVCIVVGTPVKVVGYLLCAPGVLVAGLGEWVERLPWGGKNTGTWS